MVARKRYRVGRGRRPRRAYRKRGSGLWDMIKSGHNWIKSNKIISTVGNALGGVIPIAGTIGRAAATLGYGRRRRVRRRRVGRPRLLVYRRPVLVRRRRRVLAPKVYVGGSLRSFATNAHRFIKDRKLISGALSHFNHPKFASIASSLGYGRRRRRVRHYRYRGGAQTLGAVRFSM